MNFRTIFEFDKVIEGDEAPGVPKRVFSWLNAQCLRSAGDEASWVKPGQLNGQPAIQVTSYVGVIQAPCGFQIEVLPKIGRELFKGGVEKPDEARALLVEMLKCLVGFRHIKTANADLIAERMPLLEVFIQQFLEAVGSLVKRGLRSDYFARQDNLFALRGRLLLAQHISHNLKRRDRFFSEHDEFGVDRAENRLIHTALRRVLIICRSRENQRIARELSFVFAEVPLSTDVTLDFQKCRSDRSMGYYEPALDWAKLILQEHSPISAIGKYHATSLLFPMEAVFEAYVAKHLAAQLRDGFVLKAQASSKYLVRHEDHRWFRLKPDLLVKNKQHTCMILDTKWKLLDASKKNGRDKYNLSQADFYQLYAYGQHYLCGGEGDIVLIYPKTEAFAEPFTVFNFPKNEKMRLWVIPFCLRERRLKLPKVSGLESIFFGEIGVTEYVNQRFN